MDVTGVTGGFAEALKRAGIPVGTVEIGHPEDRGTWVINYLPEATDAQRLAGDEIRRTYDLMADTAYADERIAAEFDDLKAVKALAIWTAQKLNVPRATMRSEVLAIRKTL